MLSTAQEQRMLKEKAKVMFGIAAKDSFKTLIARTKDEHQRDAYHRIPNLKEGLSYDNACSLRWIRRIIQWELGSEVSLESQRLLKYKF